MVCACGKFGVTRDVNKHLHFVTENTIQNKLREQLDCSGCNGNVFLFLAKF